MANYGAVTFYFAERGPAGERKCEEVPENRLPLHTDTLMRIISYNLFIFIKIIPVIYPPTFITISLPFTPAKEKVIIMAHNRSV